MKNKENINNQNMCTFFCPDYIYIPNKKETRPFHFFVISWFLRNPTYYRSIFIALICALYALIFHLNELSNYFIYYKNMCLHFLRMRSYALEVLLANCYVDTLH